MKTTAAIFVGLLVVIGLSGGFVWLTKDFVEPPKDFFQIASGAFIAMMGIGSGILTFDLLDKPSRRAR